MTENLPTKLESEDGKTAVFVGNFPKLEMDPLTLEVVPDPPREPRGPFTVIRVKYGGRWKS